MLLNIGDLVKHRRAELGLTQAQVAEGVCSRETLSQLEHNKTLPQLFVIDKVLDKLALDGATLLTLPASKQNIYSLKKQAEIYSLMYQAEKSPRDGGEQLKLALETLVSDSEIDESYKQFLLNFGYTHLYIYSETERNLPLAQERAFRFLRQYRPDFDLSKLGTYYLTSTELNIINRLSYLYRLKGECETAIDILNASKSFQEAKQLDRDLRGLRPIYVSTLMHLADTYLLFERFEEALALVDVYYALIKEHDSLKLVMKFLYVQCLALLNLGQKATGVAVFDKICLLHETVDNTFIQLDPERPDVREWMAYVKQTHEV